MGTSKPAFRTDIEVRPTCKPGSQEPAYIIRDPINGERFEFSEKDYFLCSCMDGHNDEEAIAAEFSRRFRHELAPGYLAKLIDQLTSLHLLHPPPGASSLASPEGAHVQSMDEADDEGMEAGSADDQKRYAFEQLNDKMADYVLEGEELRDQRRRSALINYMERSDTRGNYFNRFFRSAIVAGHHRTVEAGELVAGLPDVWDFLIDPAQVGEIAGYHRPGKLGGNWQPLKTISRTWSDQGLHYYKGDAWYRAHVVIPEKYEGRPVYLWFGGVDNAAKVWVNGTLLGTNREPLHGLPGEAGTFRPFDMLATEAIRFGEKNTVSVKITNDRLAELGTGGIVAPVMFWSPHDPAWQPGG